MKLIFNLNFPTHTQFMNNKISIEFTSQEWEHILYEVNTGIECAYLDYDEIEFAKVPSLEAIRDIIKNSLGK